MIFFYGLVGAIVLIDQFTKFLALEHLSSQGPLPVLPGILDFTLVKNSGVAFGLFSEFAPFLLKLFCEFAIRKTAAFKDAANIFFDKLISLKIANTYH